MSNSRYIVLALIIVPFIAQAGGYRHPIKWKEKNSQIIHSSVCYNHNYGSIEYRQCRVDAKRYFIEKCKYYREKYDKTKHEYVGDIEKQMDKFCYSASQFAPV